MADSVCMQSSKNLKTQNLSFKKKRKKKEVRFDMERRKCLNLEPVTFVVT
jgi:hypothetical protein